MKRRYISLLLAVAMVFSGIMSLSSFDAHAAAKKQSLAQAKGLEAKVKSDYVVRLKWKNAGQNSYKGGFELFRNNKKIAEQLRTRYIDAGLEPNTEYTYKVRIFDYKTVKKTKYYNSKKKKWVNKKPKASQWKGKKKKTVKIKKKIYGKFSEPVKVRTLKAINYPTPDEARAIVPKRLNEDANALREAWGKPKGEPLTENAELSAIAQQRAEYMSRVGDAGSMDDLPEGLEGIMGIRDGRWDDVLELRADGVTNFDMNLIEACKMHTDEGYLGDYINNELKLELRTKRYYEYYGVGYYRGYLSVVIAAPL